MAKMTKAKHLQLAKRDIAQGTAAFKSAANHIFAAIEAGATQTEVARAVGKSQPWVNRLLRWRKRDFVGDSPFADDHARAIISRANKRDAAIEKYPTILTVTKAQHTPPSYIVQRDKPLLDYEPHASKVVHLNTSRETPKTPVDKSAALPLEAKLALLEQAATELATEIQLHGGIVGARERIRVVTNRLLRLIETPAACEAAS
jgi:hypothetical protein